MSSDLVETRDAEFSQLFYEFKFYNLFLSKISNIILDSMVDAIDETSSEFSKKLKFDKEIQSAVFKGFADKYKQSVEKHGQNLQISVTNILGVKNFILLPDDEIHRQNITESEEDELKQKLESLHRRFFAMDTIRKKLEILLENIPAHVNDIQSDMQNIISRISLVRKETESHDCIATAFHSSNKKIELQRVNLDSIKDKARREELFFI